jgi:hypothetical protein
MSPMHRDTTGHLKVGHTCFLSLERRAESLFDCFLRSRLDSLPSCQFKKD